MSDPVDNHNVSPSNADNSISSNLPPPPPSNATVNQLSGMSVQIFQIPLLNTDCLKMDSDSTSLLGTKCQKALEIVERL